MQLCRTKFRKSFISSTKKRIKCFPGKKSGENLEISPSPPSLPPRPLLPPPSSLTLSLYQSRYLCFHLLVSIHNTCFSSFRLYSDHSPFTWYLGFWGWSGTDCLHFTAHSHASTMQVFKYTLMGDTVNTASRMESTSVISSLLSYYHTE